MQFSTEYRLGHIFLNWQGNYTHGNCSVRGIRLFFTNKAAKAHCNQCESTYQSNARDMQSNSFQFLINEIKNGSSEAEYKFVLYSNNCECPICCSKPLIVFFLAKQKVLDELQSVLEYKL